MNEVAGILEQIKEVAAAQGMNLNRKESAGIWGYQVIYYVGQSFDITKPHCVLTSREGKTRNCQAFRELSKLLAEI